LDRTYEELKPWLARRGRGAPGTEESMKKPRSGSDVREENGYA